MPSLSASLSMEVEASRIRELSTSGRHAEALAAAEALLVAAPHSRDALYLLAANQRCLHRIHEALATLQRLEQHHPRFSLLYQERGYCYTSLRDGPRAINAFLRAVQLNPGLEKSWAMLERLPCVARETKLTVALPYRAARVEYIRILLHQQKYPQALGAADALLKIEPGSSDLLSLYALASGGLGRHEVAIEAYRRLLAASPGSAELHLMLGHSLQSVGRAKEAIESYRSAAAIRPSFGDAFWSLANLKTYHFSEDEIARMQTEESACDAHTIDRYHLCFALGRAYEDRNKYAESWKFYERGNALKRAEGRYHPEIAEANTRQQIEVCTAEFFAARAGVGASSPAPILIVGLPRSGSTLVEQILASHSQVDGTQELPAIARIVRQFEQSQSDPENPLYPAVLADLAPEDFRKLGELYLAEAQAYRGDKPFFIDKMPNNFRHIGLIHLMLPHAKIIDIRREPMACSLSNLKQLFASGQEFTYSIEDIARYYRTYLELMRHWDAMLPARILRVIYEDLVDNLETNVRRILEFCDLEFEPACAEFYKKERSIATASSEQVRQPIFRDGLSQWRNYEPWLGPLRDALSDAFTRYRE